METVFPFLKDWPIIGFAAGLATGFYILVVFGVAHLNDEKRKSLSKWLQGKYESSWATHFCDIFDGVFGEKHYKPRCILLSCVFSIIAVFALWLLFDQMFGLISLRSDAGLTFWQALLIGAAVNLVPDYLSLYETRLLLKLFEKFKNPLVQLLILIGDLIISAAIIYLWIILYLWITGRPMISAVEMVAIFSIYSVFFYSTFLTSVWAWAFFISSMVARVSSSLRDWLNVKNAPGQILALVGGIFVFFGGVAIKPALTMDENGRIPADEFFCSAFPQSACTHVARLTVDDKEKLDLLGKACLGGVTRQCMRTGFALIDLEPSDAARLFEKSCDTGEPAGCTSLGYLYRKGLGVERDYDKARLLYTSGCDAGHPRGCSNLGTLYSKGLGVEEDFDIAKKHYDFACNSGDPQGCGNLGVLYLKGNGVPKDFGIAFDYFDYSCQRREWTSCSNLGTMYSRGWGTETDNSEAKRLHSLACENGDDLGCTNIIGHTLGTFSSSEKASDDPLRKEIAKDCAAGNPGQCNALGVYYEQGRGVEPNIRTATALYDRACELGSDAGCEALERLNTQ